MVVHILIKKQKTSIRKNEINGNQSLGQRSNIGYLISGGSLSDEVHLTNSLQALKAGGVHIKKAHQKIGCIFCISRPCATGFDVEGWLTIGKDPQKSVRTSLRISE